MRWKVGSWRAAGILLFVLLLCSKLDFAPLNRSQSERDYQQDVEQLRRRVDLKYNVVFLTRDVSKGTVITRDMLEVRKLPTRKIAGCDIWNPEIAVGRTAICDMKKGWPPSMDSVGLDRFDPEIWKRFPNLNSDGTIPTKSANQREHKARKGMEVQE
jgi:hypothetical protein